MDETLRGETSTANFQAMCWLLSSYKAFMYIDRLYNRNRGLNFSHQIFNSKNKIKGGITERSTFKCFIWLNRDIEN